MKGTKVHRRGALNTFPDREPGAEGGGGQYKRHMNVSINLTTSKPNILSM